MAAGKTADAKIQKPRRPDSKVVVASNAGLLGGGRGRPEGGSKQRGHLKKARDIKVKAKLVREKGTTGSNTSDYFRATSGIDRPSSLQKSSASVPGPHATAVVVPSTATFDERVHAHLRMARRRKLDKMKPDVHAMMKARHARGEQQRRCRVCEDPVRHSKLKQKDALRRAAGRLREAIKANNYDAVKIMTTRHPDIINYWYDDLTEPMLTGKRLSAQSTPFLLACQLGQVRILDYLIRWKSCDTSAVVDCSVERKEEWPVYNHDIAQRIFTRKISAEALAEHKPTYDAIGWYTYCEPVFYEAPLQAPCMTGLDLAIFHGNRRTVDKIFQLMSEGFYPCTVSIEQQIMMQQVADERSGWHMPNEYSNRYPEPCDYDTDHDDEWITLARAEHFLEQGKANPDERSWRSRVILDRACYNCFKYPHMCRCEKFIPFYSTQDLDHTYSDDNIEFGLGSDLEQDLEYHHISSDSDCD